MADNQWYESKAKGPKFDDIDPGTSENWVDFNIEDFNKLSQSIKKTTPEIQEESPLDDRASTAFLPPSPEVSSLTRNFEEKMGNLIWKPTQQYDLSSMADLSPKDMVRRIILGQSYHLEHYKSREQKLSLLDAAIKYQDGNAITMAVLFLKRTLKPAIFHQEMLQRELAIRHYISYLREHLDYTDLIDFNSFLGRGNEVAMLVFTLALNISDPEEKINKMNNALKSHFQGDPSIAFHAAMIADYINLLKTQIVIEQEDNRFLKDNRAPNQAFQQFPKTASLVNTSVIGTLYYCSLYHSNLPENNIASPLYIKKQHQLSDKQYMWTALATLSKKKLWNEIDALFQTKSWLGGSKVRSCIGFDRILDLLYHNQAPLHTISKYLGLVDDKEKRLALAKKYHCNHVAIDTYVALRDRQGLLTFCSKFPHPSKESYYAQECLKNPANKWKN